MSERAIRFQYIALALGAFALLTGVEILTEDELTKVERSVSHTHWLRYNHEWKSFGTYHRKSNAVSLKTRANREVVISLKDGKLIEKASDGEQELSPNLDSAPAPSR